MGFKDELYKPFTEVDKRQGRGGYYDYIKWRHVADRMNETFNGRWSSRVVSETNTTTDVIVRIEVMVTDPTDGMTFVQEGYGGAPIRSGEEVGTAHKSAYSKALKDACRKWGVGLYLDGDSDAAEQPTYDMAPPKPIMPTSGFTMPESIKDTVPKQSIINQNLPVPPMPPSTPIPPEAQKTVAQTLPFPPAFGFGMPAPIQMDTNIGTVSPIAEIKPIQPTQAVQNGTSVDASPDEPGTLTEVQKMAITHMAKARGAATESDVLAMVINQPQVGLSRAVSSVENLSYIEAVAVIKFIKMLNEQA